MPERLLPYTLQGKQSVANKAWNAAPRPEPRTCRWDEEFAPDGQRVWATKCGEIFQFWEGGIKENRFKGCPYCGSSIVEAE